MAIYDYGKEWVRHGVCPRTMVKINSIFLVSIFSLMLWNSFTKNWFRIKGGT